MKCHPTDKKGMCAPGELTFSLAEQHHEAPLAFSIGLIGNKEMCTSGEPYKFQVYAHGTDRLKGKRTTEG